MLIEDFALQVFTPPCDPGTQRFASTAQLEIDISQVLPLLNATLPGAVYLPHANALRWKKGKLHVTFNAREIAIGSVDDRQAASQAMQEFIDLVNETWSRRAEITPDFAPHQRLVPMQIYKLLPRTNCKVCGEPTCYTFALKLVSGERSLAACAPLGQPEFADQLNNLEALIASAPSPGEGA